MKIEIKTEMAQLSLEMESLKAFDLIQTAIKYAAAMPKVEEKGLANEFAWQPTIQGDSIVAGETNATYDRMERKASHLYRGFLYTKCEKCGMARGYNAKIPTDYYKCRCGHETKLENLRQLHLKCACGKEFNYRTNETADSFEMYCIDCGRLNTLVLNAAKTAYVPMGKIKW